MHASLDAPLTRHVNRRARNAAWLDHALRLWAMAVGASTGRTGDKLMHYRRHALPPPRPGELAKKRLTVMLGVALTATGMNAYAQTTVNASASGGDITSLILADGGADNVALQGGHYVINLPNGATTYSGVISGTGTLTVNSS